MVVSARLYVFLLADLNLRFIAQLFCSMQQIFIDVCFFFFFFCRCVILWYSEIYTWK